MPDLAADGPVHLTATFAEPLAASDARAPDRAAATSAAGAISPPSAWSSSSSRAIDDGADLPPAIAARWCNDRAVALGRRRTAAAPLHYVRAARAGDCSRCASTCTNARERLAARAPRFARRW
jgi:hypothetical protein